MISIFFLYYIVDNAGGCSAQAFTAKNSSRKQAKVEKTGEYGVGAKDATAFMTKDGHSGVHVWSSHPVSGSACAAAQMKKTTRRHRCQQ